MNVFTTCVYYFSLPEFPKKCPIVKNNDLLVRDILVSNPYNPHVKYGGQYDPHYENTIAPEYKMCSEKIRCKIMSIKENITYDKVYLLFRTGRASLDGTNTQYISGYYDVDLERTTIDPNYDSPVVYAKEAKFVDLESAIDLSEFLAISNNQRFPFSSETKGGKYSKLLSEWIRIIDNSNNVLKQYIDETESLKKIFKYYEYEDGNYEHCTKCDKTKCPLLRRIKKKGKLYHQLPTRVAKKINLHYKRNIEI